MLRRLCTCLAAAAVLSLVVAESAAAFEARGSVEQVYVTDLTPGAQVSLLDSGGQAAPPGTANSLGGLLFRDVEPGSGYRVSSGAETSDPLTVLPQDPAPPSTDVYDDQIGDIPSDGYGYMTMRDGIKLAYAVHKPSDVYETLGLPIPPGFGAGTALAPSPTLIEYSGYGTADPDGPESGIAPLANLMGYTVVDVNMRGTGCSGGAFDFFEPLQGLDGYDVIETVARQDWVKHGKVGMFGISYGGISQLFTAQHQPPSLAAITPLSVIDQTQTTLYPGGILNTGFALEWALDRVRDARPAGPGADEGQRWAWEQIQNGDMECLENQDLHPEAVDLIGKIRDNDKYVPEVADPLSPITFVDDINVPTLLHCQWTDEQTGGHCPTLASRLTGAPKKFVTFTNGTHVDSLAPDNLNRLYDFLQIYVDKEAPFTKAAIVNGAAPLLYDAIFGIPNMPPTLDPIQAVPEYNLAKTLFEDQDPYRVLYDNGAGSMNPGQPYAGFERTYTSFPPAGTTAKSWYLGNGGTLADQPATDAAADGFTWDAEARAPPLTSFTGNTGSGTGGLWTATPGYNWKQDPAGTAVAYATEPLVADTTVLGQGYVEAWVRSSEPNVDLQATISEISPDGSKETFVQGGWVRTKARALDAEKSADQGNPVLSLRESDFAPMPPDQFVQVTIPLYYEGHVYRAGSRIRIRISAPNGDQPVWAFAETDPAGQAQVAIGHGPGMPSRLVLPVTADGDAPTGLPPCPGLRGEPCRDYQPFANVAASLTSDTQTQPSDSGPGAAPAPLKPCSAAKKKAKKKGKKKAAKKAASAAAAKKHKKKKRKKPRCGKKKKKKKKKRT